MSYSASTSVIGGAGTPYTITETGTLPPGITFSNGVFSGTPTMAGSYPITINATDADGSVATRSLVLNIISPPSITSPTLPGGTVNSPYPGAQYMGSGGTPPYTFAIASGPLPPGITLNPSTGALSGTPTTAGTYHFVVMLTDSMGLTAVTSTQTIVVSPAALTITAPTLTPGTVNSPYTSAPTRPQAEPVLTRSPSLLARSRRA